MDSIGYVVFTIILVSAINLFLNVYRKKREQRREKFKKEKLETKSDAPGNIEYRPEVSAACSQSEANPENEEEARKRRLAEKNETTLSLMMLTLRQIGCQPEIEDGSDNRVILVKYQGETFRIIINGFFVRVWDPAYISINKLDTNLPLVVDAVNTTNYDFGPTVVLSDPDENGDIFLHSRMDFVMEESLVNKEDYLTAILTSFFDTKKSLRENMEKNLSPDKTGIHSKSFNPSQN